MEICGGDFPGNPPKTGEEGEEKARFGAELGAGSCQTVGSCRMSAWAPRINPRSSKHQGAVGRGASTAGNPIAGETHQVHSS